MIAVLNLGVIIILGAIWKYVRNVAKDYSIVPAVEKLSIIIKKIEREETDLIDEMVLRCNEGKFQLGIKNAPEEFPRSMKLANIHLEDSEVSQDIEAVLVMVVCGKLKDLLEPSDTLFVMYQRAQAKSRIFPKYISVFLSFGDNRKCTLYISREEFRKFVLWFLPR
jgi:hypothetical protein